MQQYLSLLQSGETAEKFAAFYALLSDYNKKVNLTRITDEADCRIKHFLDSLAGEKYFPQGADCAEVGSGGGFPSLPLKIIRPDLKFTLIESTGKKCGYLQTAVDKLGLDNMKIVNGRAEELAVDNSFREKFDVCTARAVARLNTLCEYCLPFVKTGGSFVAYKGDCDGEVEEAQNAVKILGGSLSEVVKFELNGEKRSLVIVKKVAPTPEKYPSGRGLERKRPL